MASSLFSLLTYSVKNGRRSVRVKSTYTGRLMPSSREISVNWPRSLRAETASGSGLGSRQAFGIDADQNGARHLLGGSQEGGSLGRLQVADHLLPRVRIPQELAGHLHKHGVVRKPEIGGGRRQNVVLFVHLAGQRFRLRGGIHHGGGLGAAGLPDQEDGGQLAELRILFLLRHCQPRFGLRDQVVQIGDFDGSFGRRAAATGLFGTSVLDIRDDEGKHDAQQHHEGLHQKRIGIAQNGDLREVRPHKGEENREHGHGGAD